MYRFQKIPCSATQPVPAAATLSNHSQLLSDLDMDSIIDYVAHCSNIATSSHPAHFVHGTQCECSKLKDEITHMNSVITLLKNQVDFLVSYLGLCTTSPNDSIDPSVVSQDSATNSNQSDLIVNKVNINGSTQLTGMNFAAAVLPKPSAPTKLSNQLRQAVVTAVYTDLQSKSSRSNNIILFRIQKGERLSDDKLRVEELIDHEFSLKPTIKHCRRLGKPVAHKCQNLLITLESLDHVKWILSSAKQLRSSSNDYISSNVFINPT